MLHGKQGKQIGPDPTRLLPQGLCQVLQPALWFQRKPVDHPANIRAKLAKDIGTDAATPWRQGGAGKVFARRDSGGTDTVLSCLWRQGGEGVATSAKVETNGGDCFRN